MNRKKLLLLYILFYYCASAQQNNFLITDSLTVKDYEYLDNRFYDLKKDSSSAALYAYNYLYKAKKEKNEEEIINAFQNLMLISSEKMRIIYADSMVYTAKRSNNDALIGSSYLTKGTVYYGLKMQQQAMDNYLKANAYIAKTKDQYLIHKVKYCIALSKFYIGFYDEAVSLFRECAKYYRNGQPRPYLNALHSLGLCYNKLGNYGQCTQTNALGISESQRLKNYDMIPYFIQSEGINDYFKKNYGKSIKNIESVTDEIKENKDFANESVGYFYIGKSYLALNQKEKAVIYFGLVDKIFNEKQYLRPDLRQTFELMINYYKSKNDLNKQLHYIYQLLKADTLLMENNNYIIGKIHKQYDTKELLLEKERITAENKKMTAELQGGKNHDRIFKGIIFILFLVIIGITYRYYRTRSIYKKNYELLKEEFDTTKNSTKSKTEKAPIQNINSVTVIHILKQLEKFENEKKFLDKDWNLVTLSAAFKSNNKYLAAILVHYRDKGINEYINGLRIDYIIELLRKESKFRNYTYTALAQEAGFSTRERFTKAFLSKTGISPAYFIEQLKKE